MHQVKLGTNKGAGTLRDMHGSVHRPGVMSLAQVVILVQTITSEFLKWTGRCCLYPFAVVWYSSYWLGTVSLTINLSVLQPNPRKRWCLPGVLPRRKVGDPASTFPWGS